MIMSTLLVQKLNQYTKTSMKLYDMQKVEYYTLSQGVVEYLRESGCSLNINQREAVSNYFQERKRLFEYKNTPIMANSSWWRLTTPFLCIAALLAAVFMPIKWMITGEWYYEFSEKNIFVIWAKKVGI